MNEGDLFIMYKAKMAVSYQKASNTEMDINNPLDV